MNMKTKIKNQIIIQYNWKDAEADKVVYYNFTSLDIIEHEAKKEYRLECDGRYYYFNMDICVIKEIKVF